MSSSEDTFASLYVRVCALLAKLGTPGLDYDNLPEGADLIADIGLDSLKLVDLTVYIEDLLGLAEFPMQDWIDGQIATGGPLSAGELARTCHRLCQSRVDRPSS